MASSIIVGGGAAGTATYFIVRNTQGGSTSQYTLSVKDNAPGHWIGDKIDLNDLEINKVDKDGKITAVDKSKVTLSKDTLDKEGEETIVITDTESKAKSAIKVSVLGEGRVNSNIYNEMYNTLCNSTKIFRFDSFKIKYQCMLGEETQSEKTYVFRNGKEKYVEGETTNLSCTNSYDSKFYDIHIPDNTNKDQTPYYVDDDERHLSGYDEHIKENIIPCLVEDFSSLTFDEVSKSYKGNKRGTYGPYICECKFDRELLSRAVCYDSYSSETHIYTFEYNKETIDPFEDHVYKNFINVQLSGPELVSEKIYTTTIKPYNASQELMNDANVNTLKIYCADSEQESHVNFKFDESNPYKIIITLDNSFQSGDNINLKADCLDSKTNDIQISVQ